MLRSIQIKIVLIFLMVGIIIIGAMGYVNYCSLANGLNQVNENTLVIQSLQEKIKYITLITVFVFTIICVFIRCIRN